MNLISDIQYFGAIDYYKSLINAEAVSFDVFSGFRKMSMINRTRIIGSGGQVILTIPLVGGRDQKTRISEIRIDNSQSWQKRHWRTIFSCYNRSPWFDYYREDLQPFFEKQYTYLIDFVLAGQTWIYEKMGWKQKWEVLKDLPPDIVSLKRPAISGPLQYSYHQVFQDKVGFHSNLSILDLLFCEGAVRANELILEIP